MDALTETVTRVEAFRAIARPFMADHLRLGKADPAVAARVNDLALDLVNDLSISFEIRAFAFQVACVAEQYIP